MTAYVATLTTSNAGPSITGTLGITPNSSLQVRVIKIEASCSGSATTTTYASASFGVFRYPSSTMTAGTAAVCTPMRAGAAAALATVKSGATISGTNYTMHAESTFTMASAVLNSSYSFPVDLIMATGSTLWITGAGNGSAGSSANLSIYFEELHLARSV